MADEQELFYDFGEYRIDVQRELLQRGDEKLKVTPKAFDVLLELVKNRNRFVSRSELSELTGGGTYGGQGTIMNSVSAIRDILGEKPGENLYIATKKNEGYKFLPSVKITTTSESTGPVTERTKHDTVPLQERAEPVIILLRSGGFREHCTIPRKRPVALMYMQNSGRSTSMRLGFDKAQRDVEIGANEVDAEAGDVFGHVTPVRTDVGDASATSGSSKL